MAPRIRNIKIELWQHEELSALPLETHILAAGLLNYADDEGFFNANAKLIQAAIFPVRELSSTVPVMLHELSGIKYVRLFDGTDGKKYGHIINFLEHQVVSHPKESKIKLLEASMNSTGSFPQITAGRGGEGIYREGEGSTSLSSGRKSPGSELQSFSAMVCGNCGDLSRWTVEGVEAQLHREVDQGRTMEDAAKSMIEAANIYKTKHLTPDKPLNWERFYAKGEWRSYAPDPTKPKRKTAAEEAREEIYGTAEVAK